MAKAHKVSLSIGRTINLGNYESLRMEVSAEANVGPDVDATFVLDSLEKSIKADLDRRIKRNVKALRS